MKKTLALITAFFICLFALCGCAGGEDITTVYFLNWGEYLEPSLIERFEKDNPDIHIEVTNMTSNEEMYTVCSTEGTKIDMVVPSDYMIERMIKDDLLAKLDLANIPNFKYVEDVAKTCTFDPDSSYSVPYMRGTVGIVYNKNLVKEPVTSWDILFDEKYSGSIVMYDSIRDSLMVALSKLGYDINSTNQSEVEAAGKLLIEQKPLVYAYLTDDVKTAMISDTVALGVDYSGAAVGALMENANLGYAVPDEGSNIWIDSLVVLKNSPHKEACERLINFLCDPEIGVINSEYIGYTTPNAESMKQISSDYLDNPAYVISDEVTARCKYYNYLGDALQIYDDVWMKVRTAAN